MEDIIAPIDKEVLKSELTEEKRLRFTNKSNNEIYIVTWKDSPNVLKEIGRLREIAFREAGGGTGKSLDLDEYDLMEILTNSWLYGILMPKRYLVVIVICLEMRWNSTNMASLYWQLPTCSTFQKNSLKNTCHTLLN